VILDRCGETEQAKADYAEILRVDPDFIATNAARAERAAAAGAYDRAARVFGALLRATPEDGSLALCRALCMARVPGAEHDALADLELLVDGAAARRDGVCGPLGPRVLLHLAQVRHIALGDPRAALEDYTRCLAALPSDRDALIGRVQCARQILRYNDDDGGGGDVGDGGDGDDGGDDSRHGRAERMGPEVDAWLVRQLLEDLALLARIDDTDPAPLLTAACVLVRSRGSLPEAARLAAEAWQRNATRAAAAGGSADGELRSDDDDSNGHGWGAKSTASSPPTSPPSSSSARDNGNDDNDNDDNDDMILLVDDNSVHGDEDRQVPREWRLLASPPLPAFPPRPAALACVAVALHAVHAANPRHPRPTSPPPSSDQQQQQQQQQRKGSAGKNAKSGASKSSSSKAGAKSSAKSRGAEPVLETEGGVLRLAWQSAESMLAAIEWDAAPEPVREYVDRLEMAQAESELEPVQEEWRAGGGGIGGRGGKGSKGKKR
jgi:tetratricopeptide (TPR) repeat protein